MILILCREPTLDVEAMTAALRARGHEVRCEVPSRLTIACDDAGPTVLGADGPLVPDAVVGWSSLHEAAFGRWVLRAFATAGVPVVNDADALEWGQNKVTNSIRLAGSGIAHPRTLLVGSAADARRAARELGWPVVIKPVVGTGGTGVRPLRDETALDEAFARNAADGLPVCLQQHLPKPGRDIRVLTAAGKAGFAFARYGGEDLFALNASLGARVEPMPDPDPEALRVAEAASRLFRGALCGIDLVETEHGYAVLEVNMTPGVATIQRYADPADLDFFRDGCRRTLALFIDHLERAALR
jgi:RimK family alpha-L-glutamate ligase